MTPPLPAANKYGARRTYSVLAGREFASKAEAQRAEELVLLERAGHIETLQYQPRFVLCDRPRIIYTADFFYHKLPCDGSPTHQRCGIIEDVKGMLTRDTRTRLAWARERYGVTVTLLRAKHGVWESVDWLGREPKPKNGRRPA